MNTDVEALGIVGPKTLKVLNERYLESDSSTVQPNPRSLPKPPQQKPPEPEAAALTILVSRLRPFKGWRKVAKWRPFRGR